MYNPSAFETDTPSDIAAQADRSHLKDLARHVAAFRRADNRRALFELAATALPLVALWVLMWRALDVHYALTLLLAVPAAGFLVRLFLIQHDCGHGAFFTSRRANDWVGRCIGVVTLTPYDYWRRTHALHHAGTGNLDRRGFGDVDTLTVREFAARSAWGRRRYRLYRSPFVLFAIGPAFVFILQHRLPIGLMRAGIGPWLSTLGTTAAVVAVSTGIALLIGLEPFLMVQLPITLIGSSIGVWLFYVQHQFEGTYWRAAKDWRFHEAALYGSSHYALPQPLRWFTANIGMHHIHHLCSSVPFYRLRTVLRTRPELATINRLTFWQSVRLVRLTLWDEAEARLVSFAHLRART